MNRFLLAAIASGLFTIATGTALAEPVVAPAAPAAPAVNSERGKEIAATVCFDCHGADGNSVSSANPKLAGQSAGYIYKQLRNFKAAEGKAPERVNPIMNGMASGLTDDDMKSVAAYYAAQPRISEVAKNRESAEYARQIYRAGDASKGLPACAGCHGPSGMGIPPEYPRLSGQFADYTDAQLRSFRAGDNRRTNDPNKMMRMVTDGMSNVVIKALSDYIAGLR